MPVVNVALLIYAILLIALGAFGYWEKGSIISLIAGGIAGLLVLGSLALAKSSPRAGRIASAVIALLMLGQMSRKAFEDKTGHTITLTLASAIVLAILIGAHFYARSKKQSAVE